MSTDKVVTVHVNAIAPQFLVDDVERTITYYTDKLGFTLDFNYQSFYASVSRDGCAIHLKCAPKTVSDRAHRKENEHLDAYINVTGVEELYQDFKSRGAMITRGLESQVWAQRDFYVEDPDGYILCFSEAIE